MSRITLFEEDYDLAIPGAPGKPSAGSHALPSEHVEAMNIVRPFMPEAQMRFLEKDLLCGEEAQFFVDKIAELAGIIKTMPATYEQDGKGNEAVAFLHYFYGHSHWYITEKDKDGAGTEQAFGYAVLNGDLVCAELGYISIDELRGIGLDVQLDFHYAPQPLSQIKASMVARYG